jgi:hypothetical protein
MGNGRAKPWPTRDPRSVDYSSMSSMFAQTVRSTKGVSAECVASGKTRKGDYGESDSDSGDSVPLGKRQKVTAASGKTHKGDEGESDSDPEDSVPLGKRQKVTGT